MFKNLKENLMHEVYCKYHVTCWSLETANWLIGLTIVIFTVVIDVAWLLNSDSFGLKFRLILFCVQKIKPSTHVVWK